MRFYGSVLCSVVILHPRSVVNGDLSLLPVVDLTGLLYGITCTK